MKTMKIYAIIGTVLVALIFLGCSKDNDPKILPDPVSNLTETEKSGLLQMVEIEKLHNDVYTKLSEKYCDKLFTELCSCDGNFMDLLCELVDKYEIENPMNSRGPGVYANHQAQLLYNEFSDMQSSEKKNCLLFARELENMALAKVEWHLAKLQGNNDIKELYEHILEETQCQRDNITNHIENRVSVEHPGNPEDAI